MPVVHQGTDHVVRMRATLVPVLACVLAVSAAPLSQDLTGYWQLSGQCLESNVVPAEFMRVHHCGGTVLVSIVE